MFAVVCCVWLFVDVRSYLLLVVVVCRFMWVDGVVRGCLLLFVAGACVCCRVLMCVAVCR